MSQWIGTARSNYFRVKNEQAFRAAMEPLEVSVVNEEGKFAILSEHEYGGWAGWIFPDEGEPIEIDHAGTVSEHLAPGEVAILMESGAEKRRYVTGYAIAVNDRNERRTVSIDSIYELAAELGSSVTRAAY